MRERKKKVRDLLFIKGEGTRFGALECEETKKRRRVERRTEEEGSGRRGNLVKGAQKNGNKQLSDRVCCTGVALSSENLSLSEACEL